MKTLAVLVLLLASLGLKAQTDSNRVVITDNGDRMEMQIGDTVFTVSYETMYFHYLQNGVDRALSGDYEGAISEFNVALLYKTDEPQVYYNLGLAYYNLGSYAQAILDFTRAVEVDKGFASAYSQRGIALCMAGQVEESLTDFDMAIQLEPDKGVNYYNKGIALLQLGEMSEACTLLESAKTLGYENAGSVYGTYCP